MVSISSDGNVDVFEIKRECENCSQTFSFNEFEKHICEFSDPMTIVYDDEKMNILWYESELRKIYAENNARIENFLNEYANMKEVKEEKGVKKSQPKKPILQAKHKCNVCNRVYVHTSGLKRHTELQHNENILSSNDNTTISRQANIQEPSEQEAIKCLVCGRIFDSLKTCFSHLKSDHPKYFFDESEISLKVGDSLLFAKSQLSYLFQCEFCDFLFAETSDLFDHTAVHDINKGFECKGCKLESRILTVILNHRNNDCPDKISENNFFSNYKRHFACSDCEGKFDSLTSLYAHRYVLNVLND